MFKIIYYFSILLIFSQCGGGGGGTKTTAGISSPFSCTSSSLSNDGIYVPCSNKTLSLTENNQKGSYSSSKYSNYGFFTGSFASYSTSRISVPSTSEFSVNHNFSTSHITDTNAVDSWALGWTGTGVTINVIDDHINNQYSIKLGSFSIDQTATSRLGTSYESLGNYQNTYEHYIDVSHGDLVSYIAGGDKRIINEYSLMARPENIQN